MTKILFVCLGNICRSPLAEAIFNHKIRQYGLESHFFADSAGTSNYHVGDRPDPRTIRVAGSRKVPIAHLGRQLSPDDQHHFHHILVMDGSNLRDAIARFGAHPEGLRLMRDFEPGGQGLHVPDPYYGDMRDFEACFDILDNAMEHFIAFLKERHLDT
jgi:protein-tyrosine phosphatase